MVPFWFWPSVVFIVSLTEKLRAFIVDIFSSNLVKILSLSEPQL